MDGPRQGQDQACDIVLTGRVQGVGYRPFVYRIAQELGITGWVLNGAGKVYIRAEGPPAALERLQEALVGRAPPLARPVLSSCSGQDLEDFDSFQIRASDDAAEPEIHVPPDLFTCDECLAELSDPGERRHGYPFINCTQCGPRYTIITEMPYDRPNTSMADFPLCDDCRREYEAPADRRFHAQPLACEKCGPSLSWHSGDEKAVGNEAALERAVRALRDGAVVAVKGVGGYHLVCDAANDDAVRRLRERKRRPHKPLAVMFPIRGADGLDAVREHTEPGACESGLITDPARPIVLARLGAGSKLSPELAPGLGELGVFLPYSPLHHRLLGRYDQPLVATSGNLSGEPVLTDNEEAGRRLAAICDGFLQHDRPIVRPADDPVFRVIAERAQLIRPGRGIAPLEIDLPEGPPVRPTVALGGHMKNTVALAWDRRVVVSPHIGELDSPRSMDIFAAVVADLQRLYGVEAGALVYDAHPGYASTRWAANQDLPSTRVLHHHAHASALAGEHPDISGWLVFTWDGVGYGGDGTLWGGEALLGAPGRWKRVASFRPFKLVGGDKAGREPWRSAAALMWGEDRPWDPGVPGAQLAESAWRHDTGVHETSAAGRLFDAAAALVTGRKSASFEGQGPMELEALAGGTGKPLPLPLSEDDKGIWRADWAQLLTMLNDESIEPRQRAADFHASMAQSAIDQAMHLATGHRFEAVGLSGGVFQNRALSEAIRSGLAARGIDVRLHERVPANDGGLCFGQIIESLALSHSAAGEGMLRP